ncbi:VWA domain-containing protein [Neobacillus sp. LXY-1]|uniref:VWA domain-containing protein n=1 Tax=Neobacillus sp. LXY-1 TaxID=3379133 RepID=UPI003EE335E1
MALEFKYPILFILLIPALYIVFLYFKQTKAVPSAESVLIGLIRTLLFSLIIFALTVPQVLLPAKQEKVIFLADRSASYQQTENSLLKWLDESVQGKNANQTFAVASFADSVTMEQSFTNRKRVITQFNSKIEKGETNLEEGIQFAASLFQKGESGRIVLLSDGNETVGNSREAAKLLQNRNVSLDYVRLPLKTEDDMAITKLEVPPTSFVGENTLINVSISSTVEKNANIRISLNNQDLLLEKVDVKEGNNQYTFTHQSLSPGMAVYKAELEVDDDRFIENNSLNAVSKVKGTPKILVVQGNQKDALTEILTNSGLIVDSLVPEKLPTTLEGFLQYQSIIFNNIPATKVSGSQMNLMEKAVKEFGTGFVMLGGDDSFGLGGYFKTPIERLLPVNMDIKGKKQMPSLGLVIVIDRSGSMGGSKLTLAKEAAARSAELLREQDTLGFIAFDDRPWTIIETKPIQNKSKAIEKIRSVTVGGGTNIYPALAKAYEELADLKLQRKHIILLTDGQSATGGEYQTLIEGGKDNNITLSTVALGSDADRNLLEQLATDGNGRYYDVIDASVIPSILSRETVMTTRTYIEDTPFYPTVQAYPDWTAIFQQGIPKMNAYIAVTPKNRAQLPIISQKKDPILAKWQYGLGTTFAFTSDVTGKWSGDFSRWADWPKFLSQMVAQSLPQYDSEPYHYSIENQDGNSVIHLTEAEGNFRPMDATIVSQNGKVLDTNVKSVAPGKTDMIFPNKPGMYFLRVKQSNHEGHDRVFQTGFSIPYSDEYLMKGTNQLLLKDLASITGGKQLSFGKEAFRPIHHKSSQTQTISQLLLFMAFLLFVLEIVIRRFGVKPFYHIMNKIRLNLYKEEVVNHTSGIQHLVKAKEKVQVKTTKRVQENMNEFKFNKSPVKKVKKQTITPSVSSEDKEERMKRLLEARKRRK